MSRPLLLAVAGLLLAAPAASAELALPQVHPTVTGSSAGRGVVVRIAAGRPFPLRSIGGQRARMVCAGYLRVPGGWVEDAGLAHRVRLPRAGGTLRVPTRRLDVDVCSIRQGSTRFAAVGVTRRGRTYLAEAGAVRALELPYRSLPGEPEPPPLAQAIERGGGKVVALDGPDASPPPDRVGYWVQGDRSVAAVLTPAGRRVFTDSTGPEEIRTNVLRMLAARLSDDVLP